MTTHRYQRLQAILQQLLQGERQTIEELSTMLDLTPEYLSQDLELLKKVGIPFSQDHKTGIQLAADYSPMPIQLTEDEALAIITAGQLDSSVTDASLVITYKQALNKIRHALHLEEVDRSPEQEKNTTPLLSDRDQLSMIRRAITNRNLLHIHYETSYSEEHTVRDVEAQALYLTHEVWILIAWCRLREDYREFRLDRISSIQLKKERFEPREFELMKYFYSILSP